MKDDLERARKVHEVIENVIVFITETHAQTSYEPLKTFYERMTDGVDILIKAGDCLGKGDCEITANDVHGLFEQLDDLSAEIVALEMELMLSESENTEENP